MKYILFITFSFFMGLSAMAEEKLNGIIAYADGSETCYLLSEMPTVTYDKGNAILTIGGKQVATIKLEGNKTLVVTYGKYVSNSIDEVGVQPSKVTRNGKYIGGGRIVIIGKDGKQYDAAGKRIE